MKHPVLDQVHLCVQDEATMLRKVLNSIPMGIQVLRSVRNTKKEIVDFEYVIVNEVTEKLTRRKDLPGKSIITEYPGVKETSVFNDMVEVVKSGKSKNSTHYYNHEGFNHWFNVRYIRFEDGLVVVTQDVT